MKNTIHYSTKEYKTGKGITSLFLIFSLVFLLVSCGGDNTDELYMYHAVLSELKSADPQIAAGDAAGVIINNCFDGLVYVDANGDIQNGAAERHEISRDGLTYTFYLRQDLSWRLTDTAKKALGDKLPENFDSRVTAHDFVFALRRAIAPDTKAGDAPLLLAVVNYTEVAGKVLAVEELGVRALSDYVLEIRLNYTQPEFLYTLAKPICMPCNEVFFEACDGRYGLAIKYMLTNGPFYFSRWEEGSSLRLTRNDDYRGNRTAEANAVYLYVNANEDDVLAKLADGSYTSAFINSAQAAALKKPQNFEFFEMKNILWSLVFNMSDEALSNKSLRQAVSYSINPEIFSSQNGIGETASRFVPLFCVPEFEKKYASPGPVAFDEAAAREKLQEALSITGKSTLTLTLLCAEEHEALMKAQQQEWQRILGVTVTIKVSAVPMAQMIESVESGNYELAFYPITASAADVRSFFKSFSSGNARNIAGMASEAYDSELSKLQKSASADETADICGNIENILAENLPYCPVYYDSTCLVTSKDIEGIYFYSSPDNVCFTFAQRKT